MLIIRLQRSGKTNRAEYRIILAEKQAAADKKFIEVLGHYNPRTKNFGIKEDRLQYWMSQHVTLSPTVHNLFVTKDLLKQPKVKAFSIPKKPVEPEAPAAQAAETEAPAAEFGHASTTDSPSAETTAEVALETSAETETPATPEANEAPAAAPPEIPTDEVKA